MRLSKKLNRVTNTTTQQNCHNFSTRDGFGEAIVQAAKQDPNIVVVTADLTESTRVEEFAKTYPERFFQVGVAEQNLAGIGAGLALKGKTVFITSFGVFSPGRNWDQIRISICYSNANVKIVGSHAGIATGQDGATHQALEDIALTRVLPNMTVVSPCDYLEAKKATRALARHKGPAYLRLSRPKTPLLTKDETKFELGKAYILQEGTDVTVAGCGPILAEVLTAAEQLTELSIEIINCPTIKPLDQATLLTSVKKTGKVVVVEDHQVAGGLGSAIAELLAQEFPAKMSFIGMRDTFGESGSYEDLLKKYKMNSEAIQKAILAI